jgi:hypothetical protein
MTNDASDSDGSFFASISIRVSTEGFCGYTAPIQQKSTAIKTAFPLQKTEEHINCR